MKHYVNGEEHSEFETIMDFDDAIPFDMMGIFVMPGDDPCRGFGGAIASVKMWDRVIRADELGTAVEAGGKLATTWSRLKAE